MPLPRNPSMEPVELSRRARQLLVARQAKVENKALPRVDKTVMGAKKAEPAKQVDKYQTPLAKTPSTKTPSPDISRTPGNKLSQMTHTPSPVNATKLDLKYNFSHSDRVMEHLQQNDHISWTRIEGGAYTIVPQDKWKLGVKHVKERFNLTAYTHTTKHTPPQPLPLNLKGNGTHPAGNHSLQSRTSAGYVGGYEVNYYECYNGGSKSAVAQIAAFVPHACDVLLRMPTDPKDRKALKVFQTNRVPNFEGRDSYIRFSTQSIQDSRENFASRPICEATLAKFDTVCQNGPGPYTQGGELLVGDAVKFNADPTQLDCNC